MALIKITNPKSSRKDEIIEADVSSGSAITHDDRLYFKAREYDVAFSIPSALRKPKKGGATTHRQHYSGKTKSRKCVTMFGAATIGLFGLGISLATDSGDGWAPKIVGCMLIGCGLVLPLIGIGRGCSICGGWWCLEEMGREPIGEKNERVSDTDRLVHRNTRGEITGTTDVPVTRIEVIKSFQVAKKCDVCGSRHFSVTQSKN